MWRKKRISNKTKKTETVKRTVLQTVTCTLRGLVHKSSLDCGWFCQTHRETLSSIPSLEKNDWKCNWKIHCTHNRFFWKLQLQLVASILVKFKVYTLSFTWASHHSYRYALQKGRETSFGYNISKSFLWCTGAVVVHLKHILNLFLEKHLEVNNLILCSDSKYPIWKQDNFWVDSSAPIRAVPSPH